MDAIANPAGQPLARLEKRALEDRVQSLDCSGLLRQYEMLVRVISTDSGDLPVGEVRARGGNKLDLSLLPGGAVPSRPGFRDFPVVVSIQTTQGSLQVAFEVRVHRA